MKIDALLKLCVQHQASDLHLVASGSPLLRIHGELHELTQIQLDNSTSSDMLSEIMNEQQAQIYREQLEVDFSYPIAGIGRFRVNAFQQMHGSAAVFRFIPDQIPPLNSLVSSEVFERLTRKTHGLICIAGPSGSGKSTTIAAMLELVNHRDHKHIITIEDPIEFVYQRRCALVSQRAVGEHSHSFHSALRAALREDPDIILVGEIRDPETASLALTAAETGHLVLASLHAASATKTIDRIMDLLPDKNPAATRGLLAESLQAVIAQRLLPNQAGNRTAIHEILIITQAASHLIREGKTAQLKSIIETGAEYGMQSFEQHLNFLASNQTISQQTLELEIKKNSKKALMSLT